MSKAAAQPLMGRLWAPCAKLVDTPRMAVFVLSAIVLFAAAFRFWDLGGPSLWIDELFSVKFAQMPQSQLWSNWMVRETNPPLFYSLLREWMRLFGQDEFAARALSVVFSLASIPVMYLVGLRAHSHKTGLVSALLTAVSGEQLQYSQQVRGYGLGFLAAALAIYALLRLTDRWLEPSTPSRGKTADLVIYWAAASLAIYTHTTFFILPFLANLYVFWLWWTRTERSPAALRDWVLANAAVLLVCSWWLWMTVLQMSHEGGAQPVAWIERPSIRKALLFIQRLFGTRRPEMTGHLLGVVFIAIALWGFTRIRPEKRVLLGGFSIGVPILLYLLSFKQPVYIERTIFWALAAYTPVLATGVVAFPLKRLALPATAAIISILFVDAVLWRQHHYIEPWRELGKVIAARAGPHDAIMGGTPSVLVNLEYYCSGRCADLPDLALRQPIDQDVLHDYLNGTEVGTGDIQERLKGVQRVWVVHRGLAQKLEPILARVAVLEDADVLESDPLVQVSPAQPWQLRLSRWRVKASPASDARDTPPPQVERKAGSPR